MAIQDSFNINQALTSRSYAYQCWYNFNYGKNTMGLSTDDIGAITDTWRNELNDWITRATTDSNEYEIPDDDMYFAHTRGENQAKDKTGYDGGYSAGEQVLGWTNAAASVGNAAVQSAPVVAKGVKAAASAVGKFFGKGTAKVAEKGAEKGVEEGVKKGTEETATQTSKGASNVGAYVAAGIAIATAAKYWIMQPNKEQKLACDALQDEMVNAQDALAMAQDAMATARDEGETRSVEAQIVQEEAGITIEEQTTQLLAYKASYDELLARYNAGEQLTDGERELLVTLAPLMAELQEGIVTTRGDASDDIDDIQDDIGDIQGAYYDVAAETRNEVKGLTDYAASFDKTTQTMCYVETASQGANTVSGAIAGAQLIAMGGPWNIANIILGAASIAAGVSSGVAAGQQMKYAGEVGTEISMREFTQETNDLTLEDYNQSIDIYQGQVETVEGLTVAVPVDIDDITTMVGEVSQGAETIAAGPNNTPAAPVGGTRGGTPTGSPQGGNNNDPEKPPKIV